MTYPSASQIFVGSSRSRNIDHASRSLVEVYLIFLRRRCEVQNAHEAVTPPRIRRGQLGRCEMIGCASTINPVTSTYGHTKDSTGKQPKDETYQISTYME